MKKSKVLFALIIISLCLLCSCELIYNKNTAQGKMWFVGFGANYKKGYTYESGRGSIYRLNDLEYTIDDIVEQEKAFKALAKKANVEFESILFTGSTFGQDDYCGWQNYQDVLKANLNAKDEDIIIFAFSGHGGGTKNRPLVYDGTSAFNENTIIFYPKTNTSTLIEQVAIEDVYNFIDSFNGIKFIICDTCYSGSFIVGDGVTVNTEIYDTKPISLLFNRNIRQSSSVWVLSACTLIQESTEPDSAPYLFYHGGLTYFLLEALGWNEDKQEIENIKALQGKIISAGSIANYIYKNGGKYTWGGNSQTPVFSAGSSDIILFKF